jgi:ribosomal protein S18 acetylase RimI-like enzyme
LTEDAAGYEFAAMRIDDYDAVAALWGRVPGMGRIETREELAMFLDRNPSLSQVALYGGQVVAAVLAGHDGRRGYLYHLAVAFEHRRHGLARRLVERCLERLAALGLNRCGLQVYRTNDDGMAFWRQAGWTEREDVQAFTIDLQPRP